MHLDWRFNGLRRIKNVRTYSYALVAGAESATWRERRHVRLNSLFIHCLCCALRGFDNSIGSRWKNVFPSWCEWGQSIYILAAVILTTTTISTTTTTTTITMSTQSRWKMLCFFTFIHNEWCCFPSPRRPSYSYDSREVYLLLQLLLILLLLQKKKRWAWRQEGIIIILIKNTHIYTIRLLYFLTVRRRYRIESKQTLHTLTLPWRFHTLPNEGLTEREQTRG